MYEIFSILSKFATDIFATAEDLYTLIFIDKETVGGFLNYVIPIDLGFIQNILDTILPWSFYDMLLVSLPVYIGLCIVAFLRNIFG